MRGADAGGEEKTGVKLGVEHVNAVAGDKHQSFGEKHSIPPADEQLLRIPETVPYIRFLQQFVGGPRSCPH